MLIVAKNAILYVYIQYILNRPANIWASNRTDFNEIKDTTKSFSEMNEGHSVC